MIGQTPKALDCASLIALSQPPEPAPARLQRKPVVVDSIDPEKARSSSRSLKPPALPRGLP